MWGYWCSTLPTLCYSLHWYFMNQHYDKNSQFIFTKWLLEVHTRHWSCEKFHHFIFSNFILWIKEWVWYIAGTNKACNLLFNLSLLPTDATSVIPNVAFACIWWMQVEVNSWETCSRVQINMLTFEHLFKQTSLHILFKYMVCKICKVVL